MGPLTKNMGMLAEPKRRVKYSTDPRGLNWSNDENKFGHKLMEKMGWQKGRGLGATLSGETEAVSVKLKNDNPGLGFSKKNEDNWIAHQDDFNALLASLNGQNTSNNSENKAVTNLEETSKKSKGRLHYKKFTRGKDLSKANRENMDCIFGQRKLSIANEKSSKENECKNANSFGNSKEQYDIVKDNNGVLTVTSSVSVGEYFAKKMSALNKKNVILKESSYELDKTGDTFESAIESKKAKKRKLSGTKCNITENISNKIFHSSDLVEEIVCNSSSGSKKRKKKEKTSEVLLEKDKDINNLESHKEDENDMESHNDGSHKIICDSNDLVEEIVCNSSSDSKKRKKKKKSSEVLLEKDNDIDNLESHKEDENNMESNNDGSHKTKRKKIRKASAEKVYSLPGCKLSGKDDDTTTIKKSKKKKISNCYQVKDCNSVKDVIHKLNGRISSLNEDICTVQTKKEKKYIYPFEVNNSAKQFIDTLPTNLFSVNDCKDLPSTNLINCEVSNDLLNCNKSNKTILASIYKDSKIRKRKPIEYRCTLSEDSNLPFTLNKKSKKKKLELSKNLCNSSNDINISTNISTAEIISSDCKAVNSNDSGDSLCNNHKSANNLISNNFKETNIKEVKLFEKQSVDVHNSCQEK